MKEMVGSPSNLIKKGVKMTNSNEHLDWKKKKLKGSFIGLVFVS